MMKLGANLNGFTIVTEPTNNDAGMSQWCHAEREGQRYFMKMYLSPKYPTASAPGTAAGKERRRVECERFEQRQLAIVKRLRPDGPGGGHLVTTLAFFRLGPCYYKITRLIDIDKDVRLQDFAPDAQSVALRSLLFALKLMHDVDIVHGDLKPENVLFERTSAGAVLCKLIDFDEAYVSGEPPDVLTIVGDPRYYSPELYRYVKQDGTVTASDLTLKADIFALGLLIHILLTGAFPLFDESVYGYPCEAVVGEAGLTFHHALPTGPIRATLAQMLHADPAARPGIDEVIEAIRGNDLRAAAESIQSDAGAPATAPLAEAPVEPPVESVAELGPPSVPVPVPASEDPDATPPGGTPRLRSTFNRSPSADPVPDAMVPEDDAPTVTVVPAEAHPEHGAATGGLVAFVSPDHGRDLGVRERGRGRPGSVDVGWPSW